ncbi:MAG TPA: HAD hydrolase-like protein, partial [Chthoniobacterales bacterium]|nr:HAD hydrolase-like protein [Chthoniobacterales bacterium]
MIQRVRFRNLIFDLDGTLVDSLGGIEASARHAAGTCLPARELPSMRELIGPPIAKMFETLWPELPPDELKRLVGCFREHYDTEGCLLSQLYPGVRETLAALKEKEAVLFVLTNKPRYASRMILEHLGIWPYFTDLVSPDSREPAFRAKREGAQYLQKKYGLEPAATL